MRNLQNGNLRGLFDTETLNQFSNSIGLINESLLEINKKTLKIFSDFSNSFSFLNSEINSLNSVILNSSSNLSSFNTAFDILNRNLLSASRLIQVITGRLEKEGIFQKYKAVEANLLIKSEGSGSAAGENGTGDPNHSDTNSMFVGYLHQDDKITLQQMKDVEERASDISFALLRRNIIDISLALVTLGSKDARVAVGATVGSLLNNLYTDFEISNLIGRPKYYVGYPTWASENYWGDQRLSPYRENKNYLPTLIQKMDLNLPKIDGMDWQGQEYSLLSTYFTRMAEKMKVPVFPQIFQILDWLILYQQTVAGSSEILSIDNFIKKVKEKILKEESAPPKNSIQGYPGYAPTMPIREASGVKGDGNEIPNSDISVIERNDFGGGKLGLADNPRELFSKIKEGLTSLYTFGDNEKAISSDGYIDILFKTLKLKDEYLKQYAKEIDIAGNIAALEEEKAKYTDEDTKSLEIKYQLEQKIGEYKELQNQKDKKWEEKTTITKSGLEILAGKFNPRGKNAQIETVEKFSKSDADSNNIVTKKAKGLNLVDIIEGVNSEGKKLEGSLRTIMQNLNIRAHTFVGGLIEGFSTALTVVQTIVAAIQGAQAVSGLFSILKTGLSFIPGVGPALAAGASAMSPKAAGGLVWGGSTYLVGEHGMELFTPNVSGSITSHREILALANNVRPSAPVTNIIREPYIVSTSVRGTDLKLTLQRTEQRINNLKV